MKTIGILGGISPQATMDFEARIHEVSQRLIPQQGNSGYPPLLVYYHRRPPVLTQDGFNATLPLQPDPGLLKAARWLGGKADFLVIMANGAHALQASIEQTSGLNVLSMVEATLNEVKKRGWKKVGVLGFPNPDVPIYTEPLRRMGLRYEVIDADLQARLVSDIIALMEGRTTGGAATDAVTALRHKDVDGIILGCTEIPLLLGEQADEADLVSPLELLAEAAVKAALVKES